MRERLMSSGPVVRARHAGERGAAAVYAVIMLPVLLIFAALAVDVAGWYVELQKLQKTVDAAALAAAPYMPVGINGSDPASLAAQRYITRNGYDAADATITVGDRPTKVRVTLSSTVTNGLAGLAGLPTTTLTRTSVADFSRPAPLGSPCNIFGRQDMEDAAERAPETNCLGESTYWVNIAGQNTNKARGDGYSSGYCTRPDAPGGIDACENGNFSNTWSTANPNADYNPDGYVFVVRALTAGTIRLQAYDIGWAPVSDECTTGILRNGTTAPTLTNDYVTTPEEAQRRYERGNTAFCSGDTEMGGANGDDGDSGPVRTIVTVRKPVNAWEPLGGPQICENTFDGWRAEGGTPESLLDSSSPGTYDRELARTFHRWMDPCAGATSDSPDESIRIGSGDFLTLDAAAGDEFTVQIRTENGGGQNRFALRAQMADGSGNVRISAIDNVSLFNNVPAGSSVFNVVRLDSSAAGKTLRLRFFDLGDASQPVTSQLWQPDLSIPFPGCVGSAGPASGPLTNCGVQTTAATHGGKWQTIDVPIPPDYVCTDDLNPSRCWVRVQLSTSQRQSDTTTWGVEVLGDPVRLTE